MYFLTLGALLLGAILGSFINALSFRWGTGRGVGGRSRCMHCRHVLGAWDLVPIFSYVFLQGKCRYCSAKLSLQYPLVEVAAAFLALGVYLTHPEPLAFIFWLLVWMMLLFVVVYDMRHTVIPWSMSGFLALLALGYVLVTAAGVWALVAGPLLALPLFLFALVSRGSWMGWGDSALELSLGWLLGLALGATALMLAFWIGAAVGIALVVVSKGFTIKSELPFAPFLIVGAGIAHFFHVDFFATLPLLFGW